MTVISAQINPAQDRALRKTLDGKPGQIRMVERRAVNQVSKRERTKIVTAIRADVNIKSSSLKKTNVQVFKLPPSGAKVSVSGGRIALIEFAARQTKRGTTYQITKSESRRRIPDAFIATMRSGHTGVFSRKGKSRTPIGEKRGPSVPQILQNEPEFSKDVQETRVANDLQREIKIQADLVAGRK